jgi:hypothetical protein
VVAVVVLLLLEVLVVLREDTEEHLLEIMVKIHQTV